MTILHNTFYLVGKAKRFNIDLPINGNLPSIVLYGGVVFLSICMTLIAWFV